eukprot:1051612-Amphidinium_carterae.2
MAHMSPPHNHENSARNYTSSVTRQSFSARKGSMRSVTRSGRSGSGGAGQRSNGCTFSSTLYIKLAYAARKGCVHASSKTKCSSRGILMRRKSRSLVQSRGMLVGADLWCDQARWRSWPHLTGVHFQHESSMANNYSPQGKHGAIGAYVKAQSERISN